MPGLFEQLHRDHINYSRLLNLLEANLQILEAGGKADYLIMQDILKYMINYPDIHHHPAEERLFEELGRVEGKDADNINQLCREHKLLAELAGDLENKLRDASSGHIIPRDDILKAGRRYIDTMRSHVMLEEREVFPLLEAAVSGAMLEAVNRELGRVQDPVFSEAASDEYRRLFESITGTKTG